MRSHVAAATLSKRAMLRRAGMAGAAALMVTLVGCKPAVAWHSTDISGSLPRLNFDLVRARDGKAVTGADYRGKITLLYFGYTYCPDVCPMTLTNIGHVLHALGPKADDVRVLFVTVDSDRDTLPVLKQYGAAFAPQVDTLRGDQNALTALAKRYRIAYSVTPATQNEAYTVTHSSAVYVFDQTGAPRLLVSSLSTNPPDLAGVTDDLARIIGSKP